MKELFNELKGEGEVKNKNGKYFLSNTKIRNFLYSGVYLGTEETPSLTLCYELSKTNFPRTVISNKAVLAFTHGHDVRGEAVISGKRDGTVLIMNRQGDCLGIGKWDEDRITNLIDIGKFLRN